ncbi:hypothetical protein RND81_05G036800 [Saponaria officinalis]|uniref:SWIM-type domain-containing protein n=1 Tax=Saponaria officinalis TaxID=3572 RepID=A0AAW1KTW0_SAPOF
MTSVDEHTPPIIMSYSPKGSQQWTRKVGEECMPRIGKEFSTLKDCIQFYRVYAIACGFDIRKSSQKRFRDGTIRTKLLLCHREGYGESKKLQKMVSMESAETSQKQEKVTTIRRFGCKAMIKVVFQSGKYVIRKFFEGHNHPLVLVQNWEFQKLSRNLTLYHKQTIINNSKVNIGASKTFRICKEVANGYENVGATLLDFKIFQREVKLFIGDADAQMFINNLDKLVERKKGFQFAYHVDECRNLCRVFWTDGHGKSAYGAFGVGIDNHNKSVTFACALLSNEDEESFVWVFQKFKEAMRGKEPQIIITDQDPAIRNAVPAVFKTARHRFCMWHIMNKVKDKIDIITRKETDFLSRLNGIVWNKDLGPLEFDDKLKEVITEYGLADDKWLCMMFDMRHYWIPAYFRDLNMGDIMSTTQRSEKEIKTSMCGCGVVGYSRSGSVEVYNIEDSEKRRTFDVQYNGLTSDVLCTCKLFERRGLICRHIFWVYSNKLMKTIPERYVMPRWTKNAMRAPIYDVDGNIIQHYDTVDEAQLEMSKVWSEFYNVISAVAKKEPDILRNLQSLLKDFMETIVQSNEKMTKQQEMEMLIGCSAPNEVRILPPRQSKNKGSGKRMVTSKTKVIEKSMKPKRKCGNCKRMSYHDSRNCPEPFSKQPPEEEGSDDDELVD